MFKLHVWLPGLGIPFQAIHVCVPKFVLFTDAITCVYTLEVTAPGLESVTPEESVHVNWEVGLLLAEHSSDTVTPSFTDWVGHVTLTIGGSGNQHRRK